MLKSENEVLIDFLNVEGMKIIQRNDHFNFSLDSVLLADFTKINKNIKSIIDLGTGNASIPLLLSRKTNAKIYGIEIQEISAELAQRNVEINNLKEQIEIICGDLKEIDKYFIHQKYDLVVSNPPFFKLDKKEQTNNLEQLSIARHEICLNLEDIIKTTNFLLRNRGYFSMVHRAERLSEILELMNKYKIYPKRLQFCHSKFDKKAKIILIEGMKNANSNLDIMPPIFTHKENGGYSDKILEIFKMKFPQK